ncbi:unnamed protein product [Zymoseptoria tritici ST99CH_3D1]|uniref:J domain-containing protein n=1 Tax=Zymoseptoria tritici ST99CH_1E4 TaxID=1276532 RepID=A0A2H1GPA6_ZYMTR|nr:unnamed protein product [Zymoseptoria tritici ST99CH_1E4]SMR57747.1 unnamed protein product [Zymoseptoria tritici ST99CH_3D1]
MRHLTRAALLLITTLTVLVAGWSKEDHEIFRLRDEVQKSEGANATFYSFLAIPPSANNDDINRAYRKLSRTLHPDKARSAYIASYNAPPPIAKSSTDGKASKPIVSKNKKPSESELKKFHQKATARFERLSLVTNVLRGPERSRYDHFLRNGFPAWRGTGYYYERFRPGLGTVLIGLFIFGGGAVHYAALWVGWKRQREFVERYISHARRMAWGQDGSLSSIPGLGGDTNGSASPAAGSGDESMQWNRRQKREMEKQKKKEGKPGFKSPKAVEKAKTDGISSPVEAPASPVDGPVGAKKRTVAENGKVLIVDSVGNVFLEEETEEGERKNFLLDPEEVPAPTIYDTVLVRLPVFLYNVSLGRVLGRQTSGYVLHEVLEDEEEEEEPQDVQTLRKAATRTGHENQDARRRNKAR